MAVITPSAKTQFIGADGQPLVGGKVYTYVAGTTTPSPTYTDNTGATANTNPVILDSRGEANIWLGESTYKFKLCDADDVEIWTVDYISAPTTALSPVLTGNVTISSDSSGPALKITQTGTGYVMRVQDSVDPDSTPFVINASGLVGLGTTSPAEALDIDNSGKIQFSSSGTALTVISADATNSTIDVKDARNFVVKANAATVITANDASVTTTVPVVLPSDPTTTLQSATKGYVDTTAASSIVTAAPPGAIMAFGASSAPTGWLVCDGSAVSRTSYAALFAVLSTTWGTGDGSTTFNLPDLRGQFLRGYDSRTPGSGALDTTTFSGILTNGNSTISGISSTTYLKAGAPITGTGISAGTTISSVSTNSIVLSANATASSSTITIGTTNGSTTVLTRNAASLSAGQSISGTNIPANAYVVSVNGPTSITISAAATGSSATLSFNTTVSSVTVTTGNTTTLSAGMAVSGTGIVPGTTIASITNSTTFVLSQFASATGTGVALSFDTVTGASVGNTLTVGRTFGSAQTDFFASHTHPVYDPSHNHTYYYSAGQAAGGSGASANIGTISTVGSLTGVTVNSTGNTETRPKNYAVLYIIKT